MCLLAAEMEAVSGLSPSERYANLTKKHGEPHYKRVDAPADLEKKARLAKLSEQDVEAKQLAGDAITKIETAASSGGTLGGVKVSTEKSWFAARPPGTENVYKIYAESFKGSLHLEEILEQAQSIVDSAISG